MKWNLKQSYKIFCIELCWSYLFLPKYVKNICKTERVISIPFGERTCCGTVHSFFYYKRHIYYSEIWKINTRNMQHWKIDLSERQLYMKFIQNKIDSFISFFFRWKLMSRLTVNIRKFVSYFLSVECLNVFSYVFVLFENEVIIRAGVPLGYACNTHPKHNDST